MVSSLEALRMKVCAVLISSVGATCPAHHIALDLMVLIFDEVRKLCSFSLCIFHHPPITSVS
jgi:hypothetical protein